MKSSSPTSSPALADSSRKSSIDSVTVSPPSAPNSWAAGSISSMAAATVWAGADAVDDAAAGVVAVAVVFPPLKFWGLLLL